MYRNARDRGQTFLTAVFEKRREHPFVEPAMGSGSRTIDGSVGGPTLEIRVTRTGSPQGRKGGVG